jgi:cytochrome c oxidase subunit 3
MTNLIRSKFQAHPFHLVSPSPWPLNTSLCLLATTFSAVLSFHGFVKGINLLTISLISVVYCMSLWFRDVISEGTYLGNHTLAVQRGLNMGVGLFIVSEALFFLAIFWAFFHSALSPTIELGAKWPPMGIEAINPFELPLLNTVILLSSGVTVTYAHHSLIQGNRSGALYGLTYTVILAIIFTALQGIEYTVSSFTISDGTYTSCFYFGTGFHGLTYIAPTNFITRYDIKANFVNYIKYFSSLLHINSNNEENKLMINLKGKTFYLHKNFLQWFVGFVDAEGNFNISLRNFKENKYNSYILTFQIGLHIDDIDILNSIHKKLKSGHISVSGYRCNYFINDKDSLINVILPIFKFVELNSSKYYDYLIFEKAANLVKNKLHLSSNGKQDMIKYYLEMKNKSPRSKPNHDIKISDYWLGGFTDGDATFSTNKLIPRLKFENHIKELELFYKIREYLKSGNLTIKSRNDRPNHNKVVVLEFNQITVLKTLIIPLFSKYLFMEKQENMFFNIDEIKSISFMQNNNFSILQTKKQQDFCHWSNIVTIIFYGYHTLPQGISIINEIKHCINSFRLTTNLKYNFSGKISDKIISINSKLLDIVSLPTPYVIKGANRYLRETNKLVPGKLSLIAIDNYGNKKTYLSINECSKSLAFGKLTIKNCLLKGNTHKGYKFIYNVSLK